MKDKLQARLIAFYLPQYHPIPENDAWWGKGFTEWRNVAKAKPLFWGHRQPNVPADLGFYDLRVPEVREQQAELAGKYGIEGFCYWHYWFNGKLLLERPVLEVIASRKPDFPFCLAWANEPWSRRWTGEPLDILQDQVYGSDDDATRHFEWLLPAFKDPRAIKVDGKPVFLIYRADQIPGIQNMLELWRKLAIKNGLPGLYLMMIETTGTFNMNPLEWGFDATVEFQPHWKKCADIQPKNFFYKMLIHLYRLPVRIFRGILYRLFPRFKKQLWILDYRKLWPHLAMTHERDYPFYPGVFPRWDNTPRKGKTGGLVIRHSTPLEYEKWLKKTIECLLPRPKEHRIVFINAWNEWAEGNYLEPDLRFGHAYLEATYQANLNRNE